MILTLAVTIWTFVTPGPHRKDAPNLQWAALEQGKYVPSIELAFRIARAFGVTLEKVFQYGESS